MAGSPLHSALREMQRHFTDPRVLGSMAIVALILGFAGPFNTYAGLGLGARLAYWAALVVAAYGTGRFAGSVVRHTSAGRLDHPIPRVLVTGAIAGIPVTAAVLAVNLLTFGTPEGWRVIELPVLWLNVTLICIGVIAISIIVRRSFAPPLAVTSLPDGPPALLERLPLPQRAPLLSLSVADHYVEVTTEKGRALILLRLSDAIREARPTRGLQIHRSHWVSLDAVAKTLRLDGKLLIELKDGRRLPVSRSYTDDVRAAGLMV